MMGNTVRTYSDDCYWDKKYLSGISFSVLSILPAMVSTLPYIIDSTSLYLKSTINNWMFNLAVPFIMRLWWNVG